MLAGCLGGRPSVLALPVNAVECRFTEEPPAIDGALDDAAWNQAVTIENFIMPWLGERGAGEAHEPGKATRAKMLWDRENLYVAAELDDADLYADITEHDGDVWENDAFGVFLKPVSDKPAYYEFHVSALNTRYDCFLPRRGHGARFKKIHDFGIKSVVKHRGTLDS